MFRLFVILMTFSFSVMAHQQTFRECVDALVESSGTEEAHEVIDSYTKLVSARSGGVSGYVLENILGINFGNFYGYNREMKAQILATKRFAGFLGRVQAQSGNLHLTEAEAARIAGLRDQSEQFIARLEANVTQVYGPSLHNSELSIRRLNASLTRHKIHTELTLLTTWARNAGQIMSAATRRPDAIDVLADDWDRLAFDHLVALDSVFESRRQYLFQLSQRSNIRFRQEVRGTRRVPTVRHGATYWSLPHQEYTTESTQRTYTRYITYHEAVTWNYSSKNPAEAIAKNEAPFFLSAQQAQSSMDRLMHTKASQSSPSLEISSQLDATQRALAQQRAALSQYLGFSDEKILAQCPDDSPTAFRYRNTALLNWYDSLLARNTIFQRQVRERSAYLLPFPKR